MRILNLITNDKTHGPFELKEGNIETHMNMHSVALIPLQCNMQGCFSNKNV